MNSNETTSTHPLDSTPEMATGSDGPQSRMAWLLQRFAADVPGVTHAVLLSRDGLKLLDCEADRNWADELSAGISGVASLAANITGPSHQKAEPKQVIIEREDCFFFIQYSGRSSAFRRIPGVTRGVVDTVLAVVAAPDADVRLVGYEMGRLVERFAQYMDIPVRIPGADAL